MNQIDIALKIVRNGTTKLEPDSSSETDISAFQPLAKALVYAHQQRWIHDVIVQRTSSRKNHGQIITVLISGGLTFEGEGHLYELESRASSLEATTKPSTPDIFQLKPTFAGMSIDLKALWKKYRSKGSSR